MTRTAEALAPRAHVTLRAHTSAPARVELIRRPAAGRFLRATLWILLCWGAIPFLLWLPPHYPWVTAAFLGGIYLAHRSWTGRFVVRSFAGICPRCGSPLGLGVDRIIDLPHTLTCFSCHFEPRLEIRVGHEGTSQSRLEHQRPECTGSWHTRWLADAPFIYCADCHAGEPLTVETARQAHEENERGEVLRRLADEGWPLI